MEIRNTNVKSQLTEHWGFFGNIVNASVNPYSLTNFFVREV